MTRSRFGRTAAAAALAASVFAASTATASAVLGEQVFMNHTIRLSTSNPPPPQEIAKKFCESKSFNRTGPNQFVGFKHPYPGGTDAIFKKIVCKTGGTIGGAPTIGIPVP